MANPAAGSVAETPSETLQTTALHALHIRLGGKMVPFAGYEMPVQYAETGVMQEHLHTRSKAGLFDVSHMGQAIMRAEGDPAFHLETLVPGDIAGLEPGQMRYTVLLNDEGGILDDLMVTRLDANTLFLVVNAACKEKDFTYMLQNIGDAVQIQRLENRSLLALQGPSAEKIMAGYDAGLANMAFMTMYETNINGADCYISRSGYTGEDGFEISVPSEHAETLAESLLAQDDVLPIGLGARDSLRLEAGLCLYGHDLDEETTPVESNLKWVIPKRRREDGGFPGADIIMAQFADGVIRSRIGIKPEGRAPLREGTELFDDNSKKIGVITSGGFGPSVEHPVAMGYIETGFTKPGTQVKAMLRGKDRPCEIVKLPFVQPNYKRN